MRIRFAIVAGLALSILLAFTWTQARAVIVAKTPLKAIEGSSTYVFVGKVEKYFPEKPAMLVVVSEDIKGKVPFRQMPINCKVSDEKVFKNNKIEPLLKRFGPDLEIIFFVKPLDKSYITFAFTNGTWFQLLGTQVDKDQVVFSLTSAEPYFRKSFSGTTAELHKVLKDHVAKKGKLPALDDKIEPGFGPEYKEKGESKKEKVNAGRGHFLLFTFYFFPAAQGHLFGVIPTVGLGAPLAILALLFPSVFGGVFVLFRQWLSFITLLSVNSTLLLLYTFGAESLPRGSWWATPAAAWFVMTLCTFVCTVWAWRRQLNALSDGDAPAPARTELLVLAFMALSCIATTIVMAILAAPVRWSDIGWTLTVVMTLGIVAGTLHRVLQACQKPVPFGSLPLATEGVILGVMLLGHVAFVPVIFGGKINTAGTAEGKEQAGLSAKVAPVKEKWVYTAPENIFGMFASSPTIDGDAIYASYSDAFQRATMVRIDRRTGLQKWKYERTYLRQMISTPCVSDGKLYFGEGFHDDKDCALFCIDAESGDEIWRFNTPGQTESSPTVALGKVFIGAGNTGVYSFDVQKSLAKKEGVVAWQYPLPDYKGRLLRFGAGMRVAGTRLYCGTGEDRNQADDKGESATFCFDANNGKLLWKTPAPYAVWSTPVVKDGLVYVTSGNGDVLGDTKDPGGPGGGLQCLDAETGVEKWRIKLPNGVIETPAVDAHRIYFGCRDGQVYCVNRTDGKELWRHFLHSPIIGTPVLDSDPVYERTLSVFVVATAGKVCCMNPRSGDIVWTYDLTEKFAVSSTSPRLVVSRTTDGYVRQLYFGCGLGGGPTNIYENRPAFYCLEDKVQVE